MPATSQRRGTATAVLWGSSRCIRMGPVTGQRGVNHCLLEVEVLEAPQIRYTQDNQTPIAEMAVRIDGLRPMIRRGS